MTDGELLSRLLDGDLPPEEARALRARIEREPPLAAAWARMRDLGRDLDGLAEPAPPALDRRVLRSPAPRRAPGSATGWAAAGWAVAAALLVGVLAGRMAGEPPRIGLLEGTHRLEGRVDALAGVVPIAVDGVAVVTVEPPPGVARGTGAEDPMTRTHVLSALAGAALTVAVYEGRATLARADGPPLVVEAGQTASVVGPDLRPRSPSEVVRASGEAVPVGAPGELAALRTENARLREQLAEASFAGALARGQLAAIEGEPVPWPDDAPPGMKPEAFERALLAELDRLEKALPGLALEVAGIDCSEYPCVAAVSHPPGFDRIDRQLEQLPSALVPHVMGDRPVGVGVLAARDGDGSDAGATVAFALMPAGADGVDPNLETRAMHRAEHLLDDAAHGAPGAP